MTPAIPLVLLGLIDAAFSGFRAYAGRDARIRKHRATARAALRGLTVGTVLLLAPALTAALLLLTASDRARTYDILTAGGIGYLLPLTVYATVVLLSLAAYFVLPFRAGTLAMVVGLGPLTLLRPLAVAAACLGAVLNGGGGSALLVGAIAGTSVLCVEPMLHRRWYHHVLWPKGSEILGPETAPVLSRRCGDKTHADGGDQAVLPPLRKQCRKGDHQQRSEP